MTTDPTPARPAGPRTTPEGIDDHGAGEPVKWDRDCDRDYLLGSLWAGIEALSTAMPRLPQYMKASLVSDALLRLRISFTQRRAALKIQPAVQSASPTPEGTDERHALARILCGGREPTRCALGQADDVLNAGYRRVPSDNYLACKASLEAFDAKLAAATPQAQKQAIPSPAPQAPPPEDHHAPAPSPGRDADGSRARVADGDALDVGSRGGGPMDAAPPQASAEVHPRSASPRSAPEVTGESPRQHAMALKIGVRCMRMLDASDTERADRICQGIDELAARAEAAEET